MLEDFSQAEVVTCHSNNLSFVADSQLLNRGFRHGFSMMPVDFGRSAREQSAELLCREIGAECLVTVNQVHGAHIVEAPQNLSGLGGLRSVRLGDGDGLFWEISDHRSVEPARQRAFGILCADCLPVMLCSSDHIGMVHAGWRGMAGGVLEACLAKFAATREKTVTVLLGPAACGRDYEVGPEVLKALGEAVYFEPSPRGGGRRLVCLQRTAAMRLRKKARLLGIELELRYVPISTISDRRFHSHRRDGAAAGRGLAFMLC